MAKKLIAFKEAGKVFLLSRLIIIFITYVSVSRFPLSLSSAARNCGIHIGDCMSAWNHWDAQAYTYIAQHGYSNVRYTAFFPLWPLLEHIAGRLFGGGYYRSGLLLANIFFYFALVLLYTLLSEDFDETIARTALFFLAFNAYGLFFFAGFTEALFLLLSVAVFYSLRREEPWYWWLAGFLGMLAVLTRSAGIVLAVPFFVLAAQRFWRMRRDTETEWLDKIHMFLPIAIIPVGLLLYMLYLGHLTHNPFMFSVQETAGWKRHLALPWIGIFTNMYLLLTTAYDQVSNLLDLLFTLLPIGVLIAGWRRLPWHYSLFAAALMLLSLLYPGYPPMPLTSAPRYMIVVFPVFVILAIWAKRQSVDRIYLALSLPLFAINIALFVSHYWVG
jgi:hypothetical protein